MRPRIADITTIASRLSGVPESEIRSGRSFKHLCAVRHPIYVTAREWGYSLPVIGREVGGRHHSTVLHSLSDRRALSGWVEDFDLFCAEVCRWSDELPPFVVESDWRPDRIFRIRQSAEAAAAPKAPPKTAQVRDKHDYDMAQVRAMKAAMSKGSATLLAALAGTA